MVILDYFLVLPYDMEVDIIIDLVFASALLVKLIYRMTSIELVELNKQLQ